MFPNNLQNPRHPPANASPVARVPRWLLWLFPGIGDLSDNPLYIRLSQQGYGRRRLWDRLIGPPDFRAPALDWLIAARPGLWPVILVLTNATILITFEAPIRLLDSEIPYILNAALIVWAFLLSVMRGATGRPRHAITNFQRRARLHGWGDDLILAGFTPAMIRAAITAAFIPRIIRKIALLGAAGAVVVISFISYVYYNFHYQNPALGRQARDMAALAIFYAIVTWTFFSGLEIFDFARALARFDFGGEPIHEPSGRVIKAFLADGWALIKALAPPSLLCATLLGLLITVEDAYDDRGLVIRFTATGLATVLWSVYRLRAAVSKLLGPR